jgi:hypothetical protein
VGLSGCGQVGKTDQLQTVSDRCRDEIKKDLREPDSARFGEEEYIVEKKVDLSTPTESGQKPAKSYQLVGTVSARNGFGGMSDKSTFYCYVSFDSDGEIISEKRQTYAAPTDDSVEGKLRSIRSIPQGNLGPIVTRTAQPS